MSSASQPHSLSDFTPPQLIVHYKEALKADELNNDRAWDELAWTRVLRSDLEADDPQQQDSRFRLGWNDSGLFWEYYCADLQLDSHENHAGPR